MKRGEEMKRKFYGGGFKTLYAGMKYSNNKN